jgi:hypothetical protein
MTDNHEISVAWQRAHEAIDMLGVILAERGLADGPAGRGHVAVHSTRDTSESFAVYRERMIREGKYKPPVAHKKGREASPA